MVQARADWLAERRGKLFSAPARRLSARIAIVRAHRKASRSVLDGSVFRIYGAFYIAPRGLTLVQEVATCSGRAAQIEVTMMKAHDGEVIRIVFCARFPPVATRHQTGKAQHRAARILVVVRVCLARYERRAHYRRCDH